MMSLRAENMFMTQLMSDKYGIALIWTMHLLILVLLCLKYGQWHFPVFQ